MPLTSKRFPVKFAFRFANNLGSDTPIYSQAERNQNPGRHNQEAGVEGVQVPQAAPVAGSPTSRPIPVVGRPVGRSVPVSGSPTPRSVPVKGRGKTI